MKFISDFGKWFRPKLQTILAVGLIVRLLIAPFFAHPFDMNAWYINGEAFLNGSQSVENFLVPYRLSFFFFVFPETWLFNHLAGLFPNFTIPISALDPRLNPGARWGISVIPGLLYNFFLKIPLIISDALVAFFIFKIVVRSGRSENIAALAAALWFLNPLVIWVSSGWGMFDTIPTLFTVLALYFLLDGKYNLTAIMIVIAIFLKFYAAILLFPIFLIMWKKSGFRGILSPLAATLIVTAIFSIPLLFVSNPLSYITSSAAASAFQYSGLSIWTALSLGISSSNFSLISDILVLAGLIITYFFILKSNLFTNELRNSVSFFLIPIAVLLLFYKFVGENYFVWIIPFSAVLVSDQVHIGKLHWSISFLALVSSVTDSLLPYYMLPLSPWIGSALISMLGLVAQDRVSPNGTAVQGITFGKVFLSSLGVLSLILLLLMILYTLREMRRDQDLQLTSLKKMTSE
jgi:GPI transamidase subunit PIG-U